MGALTLRARWAALARALALTSAAACNPHTEGLPAAHCQTARDCLPGEACVRDSCVAERTLELEVIAPVPSVDVEIFATATSIGELLDDPTLRLVRHRSIANMTVLGESQMRRGTIRIENLPTLPLAVLVWDARDDRPCAETLASLARVPREDEARAQVLTRDPWGRPCVARPGRLRWRDRVPFRRAAADRPLWSP